MPSIRGPRIITSALVTESWTLGCRLTVLEVSTVETQAALDKDAQLRLMKLMSLALEDGRAIKSKLATNQKLDSAQLARLSLRSLANMLVFSTSSLLQEIRLLPRIRLAKLLVLKKRLIRWMRMDILCFKTLSLESTETMHMWRKMRRMKKVAGSMCDLLS